MHSDDALTPREIIGQWRAVEISDYKGAVLLYSRDVFEINAAANGDDAADGIGVRNWNDKQKRIVKFWRRSLSFPGRQKTSVRGRSSTESRLSRRLPCALAIQMQLVLEASTYLRRFSRVFDILRSSDLAARSRRRARCGLVRQRISGGARGTFRTARSRTSTATCLCSPSSV